MSRRLPWAAPIGVVLLAVLATLVLGPLAVPARADGDDPGGAQDGKLLLLMDSSGSMKEPDPSGGTKIEAARAALDKVVDGLPASAQVGMRVYGQSPLSKGQPGACTDTKLVVPVGTGNADRLHAAIASYAPAGETPIAYSLQQAAKDVGTDGQRTIVLVSDGEETCNPDPCAVARSIAGQGIDLRIDVVGFRVNGVAKQQLQCIAQAGHGQYYDAQNGGDLLGSLDRLSTRAFRPFEITGKHVEGRPDEVGAPSIGVGHYATEVGGEGDSRWYLVKKSPGTSLRVSFSLRPDDDDQSDSVRVRAYTTGGDDCGDPGTAGDIGNMNNRHELVSGSLLIDPRTGPAADLAQACVAAGKLRIQMERTRGGTDNVPVELIVTEEPPVKDVSGLPAAIDTFTPDDLEDGFRADVVPTKVVGGSGFADATTITDGVYSDGILAGEALLYRVKLDFGQHLETRVRTTKPGPALAQAIGGGIGVEMDVEDYAPDRSQLPLGSGTSGFAGAQAGTFGVSTPEVRYLNRGGQYDVVGASTAGYYYVVVTLAQKDTLAGAIVPFDLDVRVVGEKSGEPTYEKVASTHDTAKDQGGKATAGSKGGSGSDATTGDGLRLSAGAVGGVLVVVLLGGVALLLVARRRA